ncbi:MAG: YndJ family transporter [Myxococcales bacterium]|nr:YndJ family transporter [Myxococcales bacterium]
MPLPIPESLLLVAAWLLVPLAVGRVPPTAADAGLRRAARLAWLPGAAGMTAGILAPVGVPAALLAASWLVPTGLLALASLLRLHGHLRGGTLTLPAALRGIAGLQLPVGAAWLVASRAGLQPMGFVEPIVVLTGIHFHFTGFLAPVLMADALEHLGLGRPARAGAVLVVAGTPALAAGFVLSPALQVAGALAVSVGLAAVAVSGLARLGRGPRPALLALSWVAVLGGMGLAATYAIGEFTERWWLNMADMAWTHGLLNSLGFALPGLLAWRGAPVGEAP